MTNQKFEVDGKISSLQSEINGQNFEKSRKHRPEEAIPRTYEFDILFTFTSLTKWVLDNVTEMITKEKKSTTFR